MKAKLQIIRNPYSNRAQGAFALEDTKKWSASYNKEIIASLMEQVEKQEGCSFEIDLQDKL